VQKPVDKLDEIFMLRENFMNAITEKYGSYPDRPIDISNKKSQQALRDIALKGVEEMFEALQHLKNWKDHKQNGDATFNRSEFLEEVVDAFNYFIALLVMVGVDSGEFFNAYLEKDKKIHKRLNNNY
jgi:NTP pyrophosphatase (non-canonical NTP hydrolase)